MALLIGFVLDQQVTVQKAFSGPLALRERLGTLDADALAAADLEPIFRERPAIHRFPGSMAERVHDLAVHVRDEYDGDAARVWTDAADADALRANIAALPGLRRDEDQGARRRCSPSASASRPREDLVPWHPTLGDVDSAQALDRLPGRQARAQGRVEEAVVASVVRHKIFVSASWEYFRVRGAAPSLLLARSRELPVPK